MDGLHIQTDGVNCGSWIVLSGQQTTYDIGTIQQTRAYVAAYQKAANGDGSSKLPPLPITLQEVPGATADGCAGDFVITNTGTSDIQIVSFSAELAANPLKNAFAYRLVDVCSLLGVRDFACQGSSGGNSPCAYAATVSLTGGAANMRANAPVVVQAATGGDTTGCPTPITVAPAKAVEIFLSFISKPANLIYKLKLALTLNTAAGAKTINLPSSFDTTLTFDDESLHSCYALQENTFVALQKVPGTERFAGIGGAEPHCL